MIQGAPDACIFCMCDCDVREQFWTKRWLRILQLIVLIDQRFHVQVSLRNLVPGQTDPNAVQWDHLSADETGLDVILVRGSIHGLARCDLRGVMFASVLLQAHAL